MIGASDATLWVRDGSTSRRDQHAYLLGLYAAGTNPSALPNRGTRSFDRAHLLRSLCSLTEARIPEETKAGLPSRGREARKRDAEQSKGWRNGQANLNGICICAPLSTSRLL